MRVRARARVRAFAFFVVSSRDVRALWSKRLCAVCVSVVTLVMHAACARFFSRVFLSKK